MLTALQSQLGYGEVGFGCSGYNDYIDSIITDQILRRSITLDAGVIFLYIIFRFGMSLNDGVQYKLGNNLDDWYMENLSRQTIANDANIIYFRGHVSMEI